jgi:hypothetical protein
MSQELSSVIHFLGVLLSVGFGYIIIRAMVGIFKDETRPLALAKITEFESYLIDSEDAEDSPRRCALISCVYEAEGAEFSQTLHVTHINGGIRWAKNPKTSKYESIFLHQKSDEEIQAIFQAYKSQKSVEIWYDPHDPGRAELNEPESDRKRYRKWSLVYCCILLVLSIFSVIDHI